jgi:hypothetical protein
MVYSLDGAVMLMPSWAWQNFLLHSMCLVWGWEIVLMNQLKCFVICKIIWKFFDIHLFRITVFFFAFLNTMLLIFVLLGSDVSLLLDQGFKSKQSCYFHPLTNDVTIGMKHSTITLLMIFHYFYLINRITRCCVTTLVRRLPSWCIFV